jgi:hypothetical protein
LVAAQNRSLWAKSDISHCGKLLTRDEVFLIAVNIAKLPSVPRQKLKDIP